MSSLTHQMYTTPFPSAYATGVDGYEPGGAGSASVGGDAPPPPLPPPGTAAPSKNPAKEEEVDALTSLLVQSMDNAADPEFFGNILHWCFQDDGSSFYLKMNRNVR